MDKVTEYILEKHFTIKKNVDPILFEDKKKAKEVAKRIKEITTKYGFYDVHPYVKKKKINDKTFFGLMVEKRDTSLDNEIFTTGTKEKIEKLKEELERDTNNEVFSHFFDVRIAVKEKKYLLGN